MFGLVEGFCSPWDNRFDLCDCLPAPIDEKGWPWAAPDLAFGLFAPGTLLVISVAAFSGFDVTFGLSTFLLALAVGGAAWGLAARQRSAVSREVRIDGVRVVLQEWRGSKTRSTTTTIGDTAVAVHPYFQSRVPRWKCLTARARFAVVWHLGTDAVCLAMLDDRRCAEFRAQQFATQWGTRFVSDGPPFEE